MARAAQVSEARRRRRPSPSAGARGLPWMRLAGGRSLCRRSHPAAARPEWVQPSPGSHAGQAWFRRWAPRSRPGPGPCAVPCSVPSLLAGAPSPAERGRPLPSRAIVRSGPAGASWGPGETLGAAAAASSCRRHRRPLHRLPRSDLAGRGERDAAWGPPAAPHPVKG